MKYELISADRELNIPFAVLTSDSFNGLAPSKISHWAFFNRKTLSQYAILEMERIHKERPCSTSLPEHIQNYCSSDDYLMALSNITKKPKVVPKMLVNIVAFATHYDDLTCHELLFRDRKLPAVSQRGLAFLHMLSKAKPLERTMIRQFLSERIETTHDISYVIKCRLLELANEQNVDLSQMIISHRNFVAARSYLTEFFTDTLSENSAGTPHLKPEYNYLLPVVYSICLYYNLSADRLLLHDYSHYAVYPDGTALNDIEREYLSFFLRVDIASQNKILAAMIATATNNLNIPLT